MYRHIYAQNYIPREENCMKKELPINIDSKIRAYSYYAYPHCIISAEERVGDMTAKIQMHDCEDKVWKSVSGDLTIQQDGDIYSFFATNQYKENLNYCLYRNLEEEDFIHISILFQQYTNPWGAINLFVSDLDESELLLEDDKYLCRLGNFNQDGVYFRNNNIQLNPISNNINKTNIELLLYYKAGVVKGYASDDKGKLRKFYEAELSKGKGKNLKIGVQVKLRDNVYYQWLYMNYIQISFTNEYYAWRMDYFYGIIKEWRFSWVNYFLNSHEIKLKYVNRYGSVKFLQENIDENKYIEVKLDQYNIDNRNEYMTEHHLHQNLIYGYDNTKKVFLVLGFKNNGLLAKTEISYSAIKNQFEKRESVTDIFVVEYRQDSNPVQYNCNYIIDMVKQYLKGENSGYYLNMVVYQQPTWIYGVKIYDEWLQGDGIVRVLEDTRVSHLLYEHKVLMKERFAYLFYKKNIHNEESEHILTELKEVEEIALSIRNRVIKMSLLTFDEENVNNLRKMINVLKKKENRVLTRAIALFQGLS